MFAEIDAFFAAEIFLWCSISSYKIFSNQPPPFHQLPAEANFERKEPLPVIRKQLESLEQVICSIFVPTPLEGEELNIQTDFFCSDNFRRSIYSSSRVDTSIIRKRVQRRIWN